MATLEKLRPRPEATATNLKGEVNQYLERASNLERQKQYDEASVLYKRVVSLIAAHEGTSAVDDELISIKRNANQQLLQSSLKNQRIADSHGTYQTMVRQLSRHLSETDDQQEAAEMADQVFEDPSAFKPVHGKDKHEESNGTVLYQLEQGAKMFYMSKDGSIQTTSETLPLTVYQVTEDGETCGLLKFGTWIYPLHPKVSPAFKTGYDAYIFPNNTSVGEFVGLMFDDSIAPGDQEYFEEILSHYSVFMAQQGTPTFGESLMSKRASSATRQTTDDIVGTDVVQAQEDLPYDTTTSTGKLAAALITGTKYLTKQLATGVVMAENFIGQTSKNIQGKMVPNAEPVKVNRGLQATARGLRSTSGVTVKASSYVVSKIGSMTMGLARTFAPNFGKVQTKVKPDGTIETVKLSGLKSLSHAGLTSYSVIYESCENAAKHLATNLANESISVVKYKYGEDASVLTKNAAFAVGNSLLTANYVSSLGPKAVARKVVKQTAKQTVKNAVH